MRSEAEDERVRSTSITITVRALLLVLLIIAALFAFAAPAEAAGVPTQLIVFTDRDIYLLGEPYDISSTGTPWTDKNYVVGINVKVYVAVLDDDGNLIKSLTGLSLNATLKDNARYYHNASTAYHSDTEATSGKWWGAFNTTFSDADGDGIWETTFNLQDAEQLNIAQGVNSKADQFNITVRVNETTRTLTDITYVMFSRNACGHASKNIATLTSADVKPANAAHPSVACTLCHWGWEHKLGVHGNNTALGNNVSTQPSIANTATAWNYNTGAEPGTGGTATFKDAGRADICVACHNKYSSKSDITVLDMDPLTSSSIADANGDLINDNDRPSCSWAKGATAEGTWAGVGCHDNAPGNITGTLIEKVPLMNSTTYFLNWSWKTNGAGKSYSHNRTDKNVACELCHGNHEVKGFPNASASKTNINEQCWLCHNITGGLNITSNAGSIDHTTTNNNCKSCHRDSSSKLDVHLVPEGVSGGVNCTSCHNIGGSANNINFSAVNKSMHASLNKNATYTGGNASNKPCWACHGTKNGTYANESDQPTDGHNTSVYKSPRKCYDCHITNSIQFNAVNVTDHIPSDYSSLTDVNTSSYNSTYCSYCHNNSVSDVSDDTARGITGTGSAVNASTSHYGANSTANKLMSAANKSSDCVYCHRNNSNMLTWGILSTSRANISNKNGTLNTGTNHSAYTTNTTCRYCHGNYVATSSFTFHEASVGNGSFGPDCKSCHDIGSMATGKLVNFSAMNNSDAIHKNLNALASATVNAENKKCWACHTTNGTQPQEGDSHDVVDRYMNPYNCTDCHLQGAGQNFNYTPSAVLNVTQHYLTGSSIKTPGAASCYACHNKSEMMINASDPDSGTGAVYGGANGGNNSTSHYGKKRSDLAVQQNTTQYCSNCHNGSSVFPFIDEANRTIANHSLNYPATNPGCKECHGYGRIHNLTLYESNLDPLPNSSFCLSCHGLNVSSGGTNYSDAATGVKNEHNGSVECTKCHLNTSRSIHPVRYLQQDGSNFGTSKVSAANCTNCHQVKLTNFSTAPIVPNTLKHSSNLSNGSLWNTTPYWTSEEDSCYYCHNNTKHNATALGRIDALSTDANNTKNGLLTITTWCIDCHYNTSNSNYKGSQWAPNPPLITFNNTGKNNWENHSGYLSSGIKDSNCKSCHALNVSEKTYSETSLNYSHSLNEGVAGGPNCISCHNLATGLQGGAPVGVNITSMNASVHYGMNSNNATNQGYAPVVGACWACHDSDGNLTSGHPDRYKAPKVCTECHLGSGTYNASAYNAIIVSEHYYNGIKIKAGNSSSNIASCINCHESVSEMLLYSNDTDTGTFSGDGINVTGGASSFYHYGKNRTDLRTLDSGKAANCSYCHQNPGTVFATAMLNSAYNTSIQNHSQSNSPSCTNSTCHDSGWLHNSTLTRPSLPLPNTTYCQNCHASKQEHNGTQQCSKCHVNTTSDDTIHPIKYIQKFGNYSTTSTNAANCTNCHQTTLSGFAAPIIPSTLKHSSNFSNGTIWGSYWNSTQESSSSCYYCHNDTKHNATALGRVSNLLSDANNTRNGSLAVTTWCADCHLNTSNANYKGNNWTPAPPLITVDNTGKSRWQSHSSYLSNGYKDSNCKSCHALNGTYLATSLNYSHSLDEGIVGGKNCTSCHDVGKSNEMVDVSKMNQSYSIHNYLNSNATASVVDNKRCWACHTNSSVSSDNRVDESELPETGHPDGFDTPKNCTLCHIDNKFGALVAGEHYTSGTNIKTKSYSNVNDSCVACHNKSEMLVANIDPGGPKSIYASVSHYGDNKTTNTTYVVNGNATCTYCHNGSSAFTTEMVNVTWNSSIQNHTALGTNPSCTDGNCHNTGRIHFSALSKPSVSTTLCTSCHNTKSKHNDTLECSSCHLETNKSIHPVQYLQPDNTWKINSIANKSTAVNCTDCHQKGVSGFDAPIIPATLKHSSNTSNGSIWGSYWSTQQASSSCYYCHNDTKHNYTSALGRIDALRTDTNNTKNGALTTTTWCIDCHYNASNSNYKGSEWTPNPPLITFNNTGKNNWKNHSSYLSGYKDSDCKSCHALNGSYTATSLNYTHSLNEGAEGGADCVSSGCHGATGSPTSPYMNWSSLKQGMHAKLNNGATNTTVLTDSIDKACWACHGDGTEPSGHPAKYKTPYYCADCHLASGSIAGKYSTKNATEHQHVDAQVRTNSSYARCENCHNNSLVGYSDNETNALTNYTLGNVSHYGANRTAGKLMEPSINSTNCVYCHLNNSNREKWANATNASATKPDIHGSFNSTIQSSTCWECHVDGGVSGVTAAFTLHNSTLNSGASEFCLTCHVSGGSASNLNVTSERMGQHINLNNTPSNTLNNSDCWACHYGYPNGTAGSHSYNVSKANTYYCEDCHGPNKNETAKNKGIAAMTKNITNFVHGTTRATSIGCEECHVANESRKVNNSRVKIYHNDSAKKNASGMVSNPGWDMIDGSSTGCMDCHRVQNSQDAPFRAPGVSHAIVQSKNCGNNCHSSAGNKTNPHYQFYLPCTTAIKGIPCSPRSSISPPELLNLNLSSPRVIKSVSSITNLTGLARDNYNAIENAKYRILNTSGVVVDWTQMSPNGVGNDWGPTRTESIVSSIDTSPLSPGNYTIEVKAMAGGPRTSATRAYQEGGEWSPIYSVGLEVTP